MKTIETIATVNAEGTITLKLPPDILPGEHQIRLAIARRKFGDRESSDRETNHKERTSTARLFCDYGRNLACRSFSETGGYVLMMG